MVNTLKREVTEASHPASRGFGRLHRAEARSRNFSSAAEVMHNMLALILFVFLFCQYSIMPRREKWSSQPGVKANLSLAANCIINVKCAKNHHR